MKKYELIPDEKSGLFRIKALIDIPKHNVKIGDLGGLIEGEENLSHESTCWIAESGKATKTSKIEGDSIVYGTIIDSLIANSIINRNVYISDSTIKDSEIGKDVTINFSNIINSTIYFDSRIRNSKISNSFIYDKCYLNSCNFKHCHLTRDCKFAMIEAESQNDIRQSDFIVLMNWWSSGNAVVYNRITDKYKTGCFTGTGKELIEKAQKDSWLSGKEYKRFVKYVESIKKDYT